MVIRVVVAGLAVLVLSWLVMTVLAKRLPPGWAKDLASVLPACVTTIRRLRNDARVPLSAKIAVAFAGVWVLSPIDLIPEFLPVIGPLDDIIVIALAFRFAARRVPHEAIYEAWPADPAVLDRILRMSLRPRELAMAIANIARPSASTIPTSSERGHVPAPPGDARGRAVRRAASEMSRWSNTSRRIGSTA